MLHSSVPFRPYFSLLHAALSLLSFLSQKPAPPSFYFSSNSFLSVCAVCFALMAHDRQEACLSTQLASQATSHTRSLVSNTMGGDFRNGVSQKKKTLTLHSCRYSNITFERCQQREPLPEPHHSNYIKASAELHSLPGSTFQENSDK